MANTPDTSKTSAPVQQPSKGAPPPAGKAAAADPKAKPADAAGAEHAGHSAAEHEKMKKHS